MSIALQPGGGIQSHKIISHTIDLPETFLAVGKTDSDKKEVPWEYTINHGNTMQKPTTSGG